MMTSVGSNQLDINGKVYNVSQIFYNGTIFNGTSCTPETCSLLIGTYNYLPNVPGNVFFAVIFGLLFLVNVPLGICYRTWGYLIGMAFGLGLEVTAYVTRVLIHNDDFDRNLFIIYVYAVTLGPAFLSAAIYLCLARIVVAYGEGNSRLKPRTYTICFVLGDFIALSIQGAGGGMVVVPEVSDIGLNVMIAGLAFQVLSLSAFAVICADFAWRVYRSKSPLNSSFDGLRLSHKWIGFLTAIAVATICIYIRSVYRVIELQAGFHSAIANQQALNMLLEGTIIFIASAFLTLFHPGLIFGSQWRDANFTFKGPAS